MKYISPEYLADKVIESMRDNPHEGKLALNHRLEHEHFLRMIALAPSTDVEPVAHARWENITGGMVVLGDCSECKVRQPVIGTNYCKNCGAKMDEGEE